MLSQKKRLSRVFLFGGSGVCAHKSCREASFEAKSNEPFVCEMTMPTNNLGGIERTPEGVECLLAFANKRIPQ